MPEIWLITRKPPPEGGGVLSFCVGVAIVIGLVHACGSSAPSPQQSENPFGMAPADDDRRDMDRLIENSREPPALRNPYGDEPPDTAKPSLPQAVPHRVVASIEGNRCRVDALANGEKFNFLIDTGASDIWFDGPAMARRLGFNPAKLSYDETFTGGGRAAAVRLREFRIGGFAVNDLPAYIDKGGTVYGGRGPLFGMSVLKGVRLEVANGQCVLVLPLNARANPASAPASAFDGAEIAAKQAEYERAMGRVICPYLGQSLPDVRAAARCGEVEGARP